MISTTMQLSIKKSFQKMYNKLPTRDQKRVDEALHTFFADPFDPCLRNHTVGHAYSFCRSIDVGFDLRIIFQQNSNYQEVILLKVGSHSELYG
ncbi:hypothetical protein MK079_04710 [Candidatus Gracilibacteria bacterium]|nr:hypothetical protein [Candidatus Gracilibacteria bacterium]